MIKYILKCKDKHEFESWFSDSNEFDKLKRKNLIRCIIKNLKFWKTTPKPQKYEISKSINLRIYNKTCIIHTLVLGAAEKAPK